MAPFLVILSVAPWIFGAMGVAAAVAQAAVAAVDPAGHTAGHPAGHPAGHRLSTQVPLQDGEGKGPNGPPRVRDNVRWEEAQYSCNFL